VVVSTETPAKRILTSAPETGFDAWFRIVPKITGLSFSPILSCSNSALITKSHNVAPDAYVLLMSKNDDNKAETTARRFNDQFFTFLC
jgi:hypothetical protein